MLVCCLRTLAANKKLSACFVSNVVYDVPCLGGSGTKFIRAAQDVDQFPRDLDRSVAEFGQRRTGADHIRAGFDLGVVGYWCWMSSSSLGGCLNKYAPSVQKAPKTGGFKTGASRPGVCRMLFYSIRAKPLYNQV